MANKLQFSACALGTLNSIYEGLVATRCQVNTSPAGLDTTNKQMMVRSTHVARDTITSLKIIAVNFYRSETGGAEPGSGATATVSAAVEYPSGTCTRILFSGSNDGSIPDQDILVSDATTVSIPNGDTFWIRQFWRSTGGTIYYSVNFPGLITGDQFKAAVSGLTDQTMTGDAITGGTTGMHFPLGIIGQTRRPSVAILGDSIGFGLFGSPTAIGDMGTVAPSIGPVFAYCNLAIPGERASTFASQSTQRRKIFPYCSHAIVELGLNDIGADAVNLATIKSRLSSVYALCPAGMKVFQTTMTPGTTTSDSCTTLGGQTLTPIEGVRTGLNDELRAGTFGPNSGYFELSDTLETSHNSGFWKTSPQPYSPDCSHLTTFGFAQLVTAGAIDTSRIVR